MTTKQPHSPQNRLREKAGGGVHLHTSLTNTAAIIPPSPCGGGDGGGVRPHASLINREPAIGWINAQRSAKTTTPFTYTNLATLYVNSPKTIGCALAHHRPNPANTAPFPTEQLPPPWGRAGVGAANTPRSAKKKFPLPCGAGEGWGFPLKKASAFFKGTRGGGVNIPRSAKTTTSFTYTLFTYTLVATLYVNSQKTIGCASAHHHPHPATTAPFPTEQLPPPWGRAGVGAANTPRSAKKKFPLPCGAGEGWGFPLKKASAFFKGTRGGGVNIPRSAKTTTPFTYTLVATPYVNDHRRQIQHPLPHSPQNHPLPNPFSHCARAVPVPLRASPCRGGGVNITRSDKTTTSFTYTNLATLYVNDQ